MCYLVLLIIFALTQLTPAISENCTTPNKETAQCVSLSNCPKLLSSLGSQEAETIRFYRSSICGGDVANPMVCCGSASTFIVHESALPESFLRLLPKKGACGLQHSDDFHHDTNTSALSKFPWLVQIQILEVLEIFELQIFCGGVLINDRYVITAANCLLYKDGTLQHVLLGEYNRQNKTDCVEDARIKDTYECSEVEIYGVEEIITHPEFTELSRGCYFNDIGLIRLNRTVTYTDYIRPICLPLPGIPKLLINSTVITTQDKEHEVKKNNVLKIVPIERCLATVTPYKNRTNVNNGWICSEGSFYNYDSGNPLMFSRTYRGVRWYLAGIAQGDIVVPSCFLGSVLPFTNVSFHLNWIAATMKP